jgi:hypothetical protein
MQIVRRGRRLKYFSFGNLRLGDDLESHAVERP